MSFLGGLAGGAIGGAVVKLYLDDKNFKQGLATAEGQTKAASTTASRFGSIAKAGFAVAGVAALKFGADAVTAAREHEEAVVRLSMALGDNADLVTEQANALQMVTGFSDEAILEADTLLSKYDLTAESIQELNPLLLDYARFTGQDAATAAGGLGKALLGNTRALKSVGIEFEATGDRAADLETLMAALESKVEGTAEAFGKTSAGQAEILNQKFDEIKETIGAALIPALSALTQALGWFLDNLPTIITLVGAFAAAWVIANFTQVVAAISNITRLLTVLIPQLIAANLATVAWTGGLLAAAAAFYYVVQNGDLLKDVIAKQVDQIALLTRAMRFAKEHSLTVGEAMAFVKQDVDLLTYSYDKQGRRVENLAGMTNEALRDFRKTTKDAFEVAGESVFGFRAKFEGTVRSFMRGLDNMRRRAKETLDDLREFNKIDLGEGVKKFLLEQGPAAIDRFVDANKQGRGKIVDDIQAILRAQKDTGTEIDNATQKTVNLTGAMGKLGQKNVQPTVSVKYQLAEGSLDPGQLPGMPSGNG